MNLTNFTAVSVPIAQCMGGYKILALGMPAPLALFLTVPLSVMGTILNGFALMLLGRQKNFTNQDLYVTALSAFGMIMAGPCLFLFVYGNVRSCYDFPQIVSDLRILFVQLSAGVSIWLVVLISIDRLLMLYFSIHYPTRVTKKITVIVISILIFFYVILCGLIDFSPYFLGTAVTSPLSLHPRYIMIASFLETPTSLSHTLNMGRMVTDRILPWILCTSVYALIFFLRDRHKRRLVPETRTNIQKINDVPLFQNSAKAMAVLGRSSADAERIQRSRNLVIGITASLFFCLAPETVFDISLYIFGKSLRTGVWEIFGIVWYFLTILNPIIYISSFPNLRAKAGKVLKKCTDRVSESVKTGLKYLEKLKNPK